MDSAIKNKLQSLLRLGLVSQSNVRRAMTLFQDPERYAKTPAYRTLMQEILVDVVDKIVNNRVLYTALRASITKEKNAKETLPVTEDAQTDRTNALLRSGLVDKSEIAVARKAFASPESALRMSNVKTYREMMITLMDSMLKKITGNPVLFNAFKRTLGKETMEESFEYGNSDTISLCELDKSAAETLAENKPTNTKLWSEAKTNARRVFTEYPTPCASGWAVKWYNSKGGEWKSVSEGKTFFDFATDLQELSKKTKDAKDKDSLPMWYVAKVLQGEEMKTYLAVINSAQIYRSRILSIVKNYKKKLKSGKYNPELAVKGFVYAVEDGLEERTKQTGVKMRLSGEQKLKVARELLDYYSDEIQEDMVKEGYEKKLKRIQNASARAGLGTTRRTRLAKAAFDMENKSDAAKAVRTGDAIGGSNDFRKAVHKFDRIASEKKLKAMKEETEQLDERGEKKLGRVMGAKYDAYQRGDWKKHSRLTGVASKLQSRVDSARVRRAGGSPEVAAQDSPRDASGKITPQSKGNYRAHRKALRKFTSNAQKRTSWAAKGRDGTLE